MYFFGEKTCPMSMVKISAYLFQFSNNSFNEESFILEPPYFSQKVFYPGPGRLFFFSVHLLGRRHQLYKYKDEHFMV